MEKLLMTTDEVKKVIPHREPMLLVDNVVQMEPEQSITTTWYIDPEREIFKGHFPGDPVLPGVYTVENMAQTTDILILSTERYAGKVPLFLGVNNVKFLAKIKPGDTLETCCIRERKSRKGDRNLQLRSLQCRCAGLHRGSDPRDALSTQKHAAKMDS